MTAFTLTEIALELLGNKFYDVEGKSHDNLKDIFASCPKQATPIIGPTRETAATDNIIAQLGIGEIGLVAKPDAECVEHFNDEFRHILKKSAADMQERARLEDVLEKSRKCTLSNKDTHVVNILKDQVEKEIKKIAAAQENAKQILFTASTTDLEKSQFDHIEKHKLLSESTEILRCLDLLLTHPRVQNERLIRKLNTVNNVLVLGNSYES